MKPIYHLLFHFLLLHCLSDSDPTDLIYHRCTDTVETILPIAAEYQCRGDMTSTACQRCIAHLDILSNTLCVGSSARPARVQLRGCYVRYEVDKEDDSAGLLYKGCGARVAGYDGGARDEALWAAVEGIARSGSGFYEAENEGVKAVAQCGRELLGCDCGECVSRAAEVLREDCAGAVAGEVYFDGCYVTYGATTYVYPSGYKKNGSSGKLVAIVLGGASSLGLVFILFMFFKSCGKKDDD